MIMFNKHRLDSVGNRCDLALPADLDESSGIDELASSSRAFSSNKALVRYVKSGFTFPLNVRSSVPTKESADSNRIGYQDVSGEGEGPQLPATPTTYED